MIASHNPLAAIRRRISQIVLIANPIGALLSFLYFSVIDPDMGTTDVVRPISALEVIVFVGVTSVLVLGGALATKRWGDRFAAWDTAVLQGAPDVPEFVYQRAVLYAPFTALASFIMWIGAGLIFSSFQTNAFSLHTFIGITIVGGVFTSAVIYFAADLQWQNALPIYFRHHTMRTVQAFRLSLLARLIIVFFLIGPYPILLLSYLTYTRVQAIPIAPHPAALIANLVVALFFIAALSVSAGLLLVTLMSHGLTNPLQRLSAAMQRVEQHDFEVRVPITTNDEIGFLSEGFNDMTAGLQQGELLRNLLNVYVSPEVAREAIEHGTQLGGTLVECSVLFSDIRNFTGLAESLPPAPLIELLNRYMSAMVEVVIKHGGIVNKFGGDSLLAVFGTPLNPIDFHAAAAIRSGLEMLAALDRFNTAQRQIGSIELHIGIGIATGPAIAGNVGGQGRIEYTVIGDTVNLAARLQSLTKETGQPILLNATAYEQAQKLLPLNGERLPNVTVRGKSEPVQVVAVKGLGAVEENGE